MARAHRFTHSVLLGFAGQAITMFAGLWLTPFLLRHLGQTTFGWWIVGQQALVYLSLMDLGVVGLLPRETAYLTGRAGGLAELPGLIGRTIRIVLLQTPLVTVAAGILWFLIPAPLADVRSAAGLAVLAFGMLFPLRIFRAVLEGLQDLAFISWTYFIGWLGGLLASVPLVACGYGLRALIVGWIVSQASDGLLCFCRLWLCFAHARPARSPNRTIWPQFVRGLSVSVSQLAQVLIYGTDAAVVGRLFGPAAIVPYNCTGKLIAVMANQPQHIMRAAEPGLSQMRVSEDRARLASVTSALTLAMLLASGAVVTFALAVNPLFVRWWVGDQFYGGILLTVLFAVSMVLRHLNITAIYTLFAFGQERRLATTSLIDGVLSTILSIGFAAILHSVVGVVLGSIVSTCCVLALGNGPALTRELGTTLLDLAKPLAGWLARMCIAGAIACLLSRAVPPVGFVSLLAVGGTAVSIYVLLMIPVLSGSALWPYIADRLELLRVKMIPLRWRNAA